MEQKKRVLNQIFEKSIPKWLKKWSKMFYSKQQDQQTTKNFILGKEVEANLKIIIS